MYILYNNSYINDNGLLHLAASDNKEVLKNVDAAAHTVLK